MEAQHSDSKPLFVCGKSLERAEGVNRSFSVLLLESQLAAATWAFVFGNNEAEWFFCQNDMDHGSRHSQQGPKISLPATIGRLRIKSAWRRIRTQFSSLNRLYRP